VFQKGGSFATAKPERVCQWQKTVVTAGWSKPGRLRQAHKP